MLDYLANNSLLSPGTPAPMIKTFTRLTKFQSNPNNSSNNYLNVSNSLNNNDNNNTNISNNDSIPTESNSISSNESTSASTGLQRFRPIAPSSTNNDLDFLQKPQLSDTCHTYKAVQRYNRKDIKDLSTLDLSLDGGLADKNTLSTISKPCPTFTRITKPRIDISCATNNSGGAYLNNSLEDKGNTSFLLDHTGKRYGNQANQINFESSSLLQDNVLPLPPVSSFVPPPKTPAVPPLSLSLSLPPSAAPSLSSASSSCSSSTSSSSSSPPSSRFVFPTVDRKDWWQGLSLAETPCIEEEDEERSSVDSSPGSSPTLAPVLPQTFYRNRHASQTEHDNTPSYGGESYGLDLPLHCQTLQRAPSPQPIQTGFCSIKSINSNNSNNSNNNNYIKPGGEPSPQDFLGEADLPYPLPSTLQERQARQRKRAEQLRQLKIREECERENRRPMILRRGNSFTAGMSSSLPTLVEESDSRPQPKTFVKRPISQLRRSPSSPAKTSIGNNIAMKTCRVKFDLSKNETFEYEVGEEWTSGSRPPSPESNQRSQTRSYSSFHLSSGRTAYGIGLCDIDDIDDD
ncbi:hypothetical protein BGX21_003967 [Mortierella sp. AD011]|nr:hypothetical protein BGX20_002476 [Mortierella sp. AD010]KAF9375003.1 hypothetical protein BGX21_003967 [Mortierella sp. AD011]